MSKYLSYRTCTVHVMGENCSLPTLDRQILHSHSCPGRLVFAPRMKAASQGKEKNLLIPTNGTLTDYVV